MDNPPPLTEETAARVARQAALLQEVAAIGVEILRAVRDEVVDLPKQEAKAQAPEFGLAYDRIARAIRMTVAMENRLSDEAQVQQARHREQAAERTAQAAADYQAERIAGGRRKQIIVESLELLIDFEAPDGREREMMERLEDLLDPREDEKFIGQPLSVWIAAICKGLGIEPAWHWFEREDWAAEEAVTWPASPFNLSSEVLRQDRPAPAPPPSGESPPPAGRSEPP